VSEELTVTDADLSNAPVHAAVDAPYFSPPLVEIERLSVHYRVKAAERASIASARGDPSLLARRIIGSLIPPGMVTIRAVDGVSLSITPGEALGLVGESGCGKSSVGRALTRLEPIVSGRAIIDGIDVATARGGALRRLRRAVQMIFQDPYASLDPRLTIAQIVAEPLRALGIERNARAREARVIELLERCGLDPHLAHRFPHEFSGGQRQRAAIARAIAPGPKLIIADEPVSALDVSVQAQIVNLLLELREQLNLSMLFIAHDLAVVRLVCQRVAVMYMGRVVEIAPSAALIDSPRHPYTHALVSAIPIPDPRLERRRRRDLLQGEVPSALQPPSGCRFHPRCAMATDRCRVEEPSLKTAALDRPVACHVAHGEG
jgi:oligopeptide/dipeptide ABC transporter ATP-binding protein